MNEAKFKPGDVVQLKSGGQIMTVSPGYPDEKGGVVLGDPAPGWIHCVWIFEGGKDTSGLFHESTLKKY